MRSEQEVNRAIEQYSDMVRRLCLIHLKNDADTEDIFQTVFLKYALSSAAFESDEHEKAWLIRVTINACKDLLKSLFIAALYRWMKFWNSLQRCGKTIRKFWKRYYRSRRNTGKSYIYITMKDIPHRKSEKF